MGTLFGNALFYGDNLAIMRRELDAASVDLVYLDPPFNSNRSYNVLYRHASGAESDAQASVFDDSWRWGPEAERTYADLVTGGAASKVADAIEAMRALLGDNDMLAYLVMMTPRLIELHRVLKPTGSLYLHCDPTASHYLKIMLDAVFGPERFRGEIIWRRTAAKGAASRRLPSNHDVLLTYGRTSKATWNPDAACLPYDEDNLDPKTALKYNKRDLDGRLYRLSALEGPSDPRPNLTYEVMGFTRRWRWSRQRMDQAIEQGIVVQTRPGTVPQMKRYLDEMRGKPLGDVWTDVAPLNSQAAERLGYSTQKPLALLERIIQASSNPGDVVLDPFCGCGTAVDAAQKLGRRWIGIDVTWLAIDVIENRLAKQYGAGIGATYEVLGIPKDIGAAKALFERDPFEFERWAVSLLDGQPNDKQRGDKGVDGVTRFTTSAKTFGKILISVKGGGQLNPSMVRDLIGTVDTHRAALGVLITLNEPTRGMVDAARHSGIYTHPGTGNTFGRIRIVTISDLLDGHRPPLPALIMPYVSGPRMSEDRIPEQQQAAPVAETVRARQVSAS